MKYKETSMMKSYQESAVDRGGNRTIQQLHPTQGVIYQPDIESPEKIHGEVYGK